MTKSVSMTAKVKCGSLKDKISELGAGRVTHSMSRRAVEDRGGLPWSVAFIWQRRVKTRMTTP